MKSTKKVNKIKKAASVKLYAVKSKYTKYILPIKFNKRGLGQASINIYDLSRDLEYYLAHGTGISQTLFQSKMRSYSCIYQTCSTT